MAPTPIFLYSSFCSASIARRHNRSLLLQFILSEIFTSLDENLPQDKISTPPQHALPYDLATFIGPLNKIREHALLLNDAFPQHKEAVHAFNKKLTIVHSLRDLEDLMPLLEPLIEACKEEENLLFFLLKNYRRSKRFLSLKNSHELRYFLLEKYQQRGFILLLNEIERLIKEWETH